MNALFILKSSLGPAFAEQRAQLFDEFTRVTQTRLASGDAQAYTDAATLLGEWRSSGVVETDQELQRLFAAATDSTTAAAPTTTSAASSTTAPRKGVKGGRSGRSQRSPSRPRARLRGSSSGPDRQQLIVRDATGESPREASDGSPDDASVDAQLIEPAAGVRSPSSSSSSSDESGGIRLRRLGRNKSKDRKKVTGGASDEAAPDTESPASVADESPVDEQAALKAHLKQFERAWAARHGGTRPTPEDKPDFPPVVRAMYKRYEVLRDCAKRGVEPPPPPPGLARRRSKPGPPLRRVTLQDMSEAKVCNGCSQSFGLLRVQKHCRHCGMVVCTSCSEATMPIPDVTGSETEGYRVCDACVPIVQAKADARYAQLPDDLMPEDGEAGGDTPAKKQPDGDSRRGRSRRPEPEAGGDRDADNGPATPDDGDEPAALGSAADKRAKERSRSGRGRGKSRGNSGRGDGAVDRALVKELRAKERREREIMLNLKAINESLGAGSARNAQAARNPELEARLMRIAGMR